MNARRALVASLATASIGLAGLPAGALDEPSTAASVAPAAPVLEVALSPREARVGDLVEAVVSVEQDAGAGEPTFPEWQRHWGEAEIREIGDVRRLGDDSDPAERAVYSQRLVLAAFRTGTVVLPSRTVTLPGDEPIELATEPASFEVVSVLPAGDGEIEPRPPAAPKPLPLGSRFWWTAGLLATLAAALVAALLARRRSAAAVAGEVVDPWEALETALERLARAADAETAFTGLSLELRRYLGRTLAFPAAESTTTELRRRLLRSGLPQSVCSEVVRLLVEADAVKFARKTPAPGRVLECLDRTRLAAAEVRRSLEPRDAEASEEEAA